MSNNNNNNNNSNKSSRLFDEDDEDIEANTGLNPNRSEFELEEESPRGWEHQKRSAIQFVQTHKNKLIAAAVVVLVLIGIMVLIDVFSGRPHESGRMATLINANNVIVAADHPFCSERSANLAKAYNGTAVDSAIAAALCMGVVQPYASGIGGGGILVVHRASDGFVDTIVFRETAPENATEDMYAQDPSQSVTGGKAVAVPGAMAGYELAWKTYGSMQWKDLFIPAIEAANASIVSADLAYRLMVYSAQILNSNLKEVFAVEGSRVLMEGETLRQPALVRTLQTLAEKGAREFYLGDMAQQLAKDIQAAGGIITTKDLADYYNNSYAYRQAAMSSKFLDQYEMFGALPPHSGGLITSLAFNILEGYDLSHLHDWTPELVHRTIESFKFMFSDRRAMGDPKINQSMPNYDYIVAQMLNKSHATELRNRINNSWTFPPSYYHDLADGFPVNDNGTCHTSSVDQHRNAAALTTTTNYVFGAFLLSTSTGILLNNEMDDFSSPTKSTNSWGFPPTIPNYIRPRKRPLSSMSPTIIKKNGRLFMVVGGAGGSKIPTATMNVIMSVILFNKNIAEAVSAPRFHNQLFPETSQVEMGFPKMIVDKLETMNHTFINYSSFSVASGIVVNADGTLSGASDYRRGGIAYGY